MKLLTKRFVPRYEARPLPTKTVAVLVPMSTRPSLTHEEEISMRHLVRWLGQYDKFLIAPRGTNFHFDGFRVRHLSPKFFGSMRAHSRMLFSPNFYRMFEEYKYILMYHLDALVFRDELLEWCARDYDFIGAPFIPCQDSPWVQEPRVGNGGFALMKVETMLKVLYNRWQAEPLRYWEDLCSGFFRVIQPLIRQSRRLTPRWLRGSLTHPLQRGLQRMDNNEVNFVNHDDFLSRKASIYMPEFHTPEWTTALRFAFEVTPRRCFELNEYNLPFGCHAWPKYDRAFWEPYLLK